MENPNQKEGFAQLFKNDTTPISDRLPCTVTGGPSGTTVEIKDIALTVTGETPSSLKLFADRQTDHAAQIWPASEVGHLQGMDRFVVDYPLTLTPAAVEALGIATGATSAR